MPTPISVHLLISLRILGTKIGANCFLVKKNTTLKGEFDTVLKLISFGLFVGGFLIFVLAVKAYFNGDELCLDAELNIDKAASFGSFISGAVGVLFTLLGVVLFYRH